MTWKNWAGTAAAEPVTVRTPAGDDELRTVLRLAEREKLTVKVVGAGHSFTDVAAAPGIQITPEGMSGARHADPDRQRITFGAGTPLRRLAGILAPMGLAVRNMGDIDRQTLAGAISTGTHGTGWDQPGCAAQVAGLRLMLADGEVVECDAETEPDLFQAARLGLGAVGVLTDVTLQCVPSFVLAAHEAPEPLEQVLDSFERRAAAVDHFEFFWFPHTTEALVKENRRLPGDTPTEPVSKLAGLIEDELVGNGLLQVVCEAGRRFPDIVPRVNRLANRLVSARDYSDRSDRVFVSPRRVKFVESEWALPVEALPDALREVRTTIERHRWNISFPVEARVAAADDVWLSTAYGRRTAYLAVHRYKGEDHRPYFEAVEAICRAAGGRPHWGKLHNLTHEDFARLYPRFEDFRRVRARMDPHGRFDNPYLMRVLGPR